MQGGSKREADQSVAFLEEDELTEDMKEKLIEKVVVYPVRIEIVWKFGENDNSFSLKILKPVYNVS